MAGEGSAGVRAVNQEPAGTSVLNRATEVFNRSNSNCENFIARKNEFMHNTQPNPGVFVDSKMFGYDFTAVFDDNGKVAYAFLCYGQEIITDVWLYNVAPAPEMPGNDTPPLLNAREFIVATPYPRIERAEDVEFRFMTPGEIQTLYVDVYLRGKLHARLKPNEQPGWCCLAIKDTDIARVMSE
jgi:hypothetical protein